MPPWAIPFDTPARNRFLKDYRIQAASATSTILACLAVVSLSPLLLGLLADTDEFTANSFIRPHWRT